MFGITDISAIPLQAAGIVGLAPKKKNLDSDMMLESLYLQGSIPEKVFSFDIKAANEVSMMTLGDYNRELPIKWHKLSNDNWWTLNL
jgi:hypothetical protein